MNIKLKTEIIITTKGILLCNYDMLAT
jgi:hypothetical protein